MIISRWKEFKDILKAVKEQNIFIIGCGKCAKKQHVGGEPEVLEMKKKLRGSGKNVVGWTILSSACSISSWDEVLSQNPEIEKAEALLVMSCGGGVSVLSAYAKQLVYPALDTESLEIKVEERTRQLTGALEEVKKISRRKSDFISSVSHEIRTPLTSIKGYAAILLASKLGALPEEIRSRLEKINRHSDELVHMVNDLLDISRIESGKVEIKKEALSLRAITDKVADLFADQLKTKNISFSSNITDDCQEILADRSQIERVFTNLVGNALKFTPQNGKIDINTNRTNKTIQIDVKDTGFGIPQDAQESIFEEFFRVENTINQEVKGTGLGLTLVKNIIEAHQGRIWVKSKVGEGSTFSFTLNAA